MVFCPSYVRSLKSNLQGWQPYGNRVDHCLAEQIGDRCKLQFSFTIAVLVIVLNMVKAAVMCLAALGVRETPLMTIGDTISTSTTAG